MAINKEKLSHRMLIKHIENSINNDKFPIQIYENDYKRIFNLLNKYPDLFVYKINNKFSILVYRFSNVVHGYGIYIVSNNFSKRL